MNTITETPSQLSLFLIIILISVLVSYRSPQASVLDRTLRSSFLGAIIYIFLDSLWRGVSAFIAFGFGDVFLLYIPIAFLVSIVFDIVSRQTSLMSDKHRKNRSHNND
jgi:hypothetical protein